MMTEEKKKPTEKLTRLGDQVLGQIEHVKKSRYRSPHPGTFEHRF